MNCFRRCLPICIIVLVFIQSPDAARAALSYSCAHNSECGQGSCQENICQCHEGYAHSINAPCIAKSKKADYFTPFMLELFLGWGFPAGLAYKNLWGLAAIRLGVEAGAGMLWGFYGTSRWHDSKQPSEDTTSFVNSRRSNEILVLAGMATFFHATSWVISTLFFGEAHYPDANIKSWLHLDKGDPDLVVMGSKLAQSVRITLNNFSPKSCAIVEKCVDGAGERRLLRFDSYIYNVGKGDYVAAFENMNPEWSECHQHFHAPEATNYFLKQELSNVTGGVLASRYGHKQGYCFRDTLRISGDVQNIKFWCGVPTLTKQLTQGIQAGWADVYGSHLDCQWIDITGVPPGTYRLTVTVNPNGLYYQDNPENNISIVEVEIPPVDYTHERTENGRGVVARVIKEYDQP